MAGLIRLVTFPEGFQGGEGVAACAMKDIEHDLTLTPLVNKRKQVKPESEKKLSK